MDYPILLTPDQEAAIRSLQVKIIKFKYYQIQNVEALEETMKLELMAKNLIYCLHDEWYFTAEGRVIKELLNNQ